MDKTRVKCANCGMIYDRCLGQTVCPNCKSNAYNISQEEKRDVPFPNNEPYNKDKEATE